MLPGGRTGMPRKKTRALPLQFSCDVAVEAFFEDGRGEMRCRPTSEQAETPI